MKIHVNNYEGANSITFDTKAQALKLTFHHPRPQETDFHISTDIKVDVISHFLSSIAEEVIQRMNGEGKVTTTIILKSEEPQIVLLSRPRGIKLQVEVAPNYRFSFGDLKIEEMNAIEYRLSLLAPYKGQELTAEQILKICEYNPKTALTDTIIQKHGYIQAVTLPGLSVEPAKKAKRVEEGDEDEDLYPRRLKRWKVIFTDIVTKGVVERMKGAIK